MFQKTFRAAAAAAVTFAAGVAAVWLSGLTAPFERALADFLVPDSEVAVSEAPLVGREEADTEEVYSVVVR